MSRTEASDHRGSRPPRVDEADPPPSLALLAGELAPRPGRLANTLRLTAIALIVIALAEVLRVPEAAVSAYVAFFLFMGDADATIGATIMGATAIVAGIALTLAILMFTLSEPALRLPLMVVVGFLAMYLSRASSLGMIAYAMGLITFDALTDADNLLSGAAQPYGVSNAEAPGLPDLAFMPPEEALVHNLLWLGAAVALGAAVVVVVDTLTGPDPEKKLRDALADRLAAASSFCLDEAKAREPIVRYAREGVAGLEKQNALAGKMKPRSYDPAYGAGVIRATAHLMLVLLAFRRVPAGERRPTGLRVAAAPLAAAAQAVRGGSMLAPDEGQTPSRDEAGGAGPLARELAASLRQLDEAVQGRAAKEDADPGAKTGFFKADAFSNPGYTRFALKTTLAATICYLFMDAVDWSGISTCILTCFVLALDSVGQTFHKAILRIAGALLGAAIGFAATLLITPYLTDLGQFLLVLAPPIMLGSWIKCGSQRFNYVGQQLAFAYILMMVQGYGPTTHFETGRDRIVGILVGEVVLAVVFTQVWPVSVADLARAKTAEAVLRLADLVSPRHGRHGRRALLRSFAETVSAASGLLGYGPFEPVPLRRRVGQRRIDKAGLSRLQALAVSAAILSDPADEPEDASSVEADYRLALATWLRRCAAWFRDGRGEADLVGTLPRPPGAREGGDARDMVLDRQDWLAIFDAELREGLSSFGLRVEGHSSPDSVPSRDG